MALSKALREFTDQSKKSDGYWIERVKLDFSLGLERQRKIAGLTYSAIAKKIGTSAAYISKIFRGDANMTIVSMVKLARATGGQLRIDIVDATDTNKVWHDVSQNVASGTTDVSGADGASVVRVADFVGISSRAARTQGTATVIPFRNSRLTPSPDYSKTLAA